MFTPERRSVLRWTYRSPPSANANTPANTSSVAVAANASRFRNESRGRPTAPVALTIRAYDKDRDSGGARHHAPEHRRPRHPGDDAVGASRAAGLRDAAPLRTAVAERRRHELPAQRP